MACFHVYKVECTFSTCYDERKFIYIEAMHHVDWVFVDVLLILVIDPSDDFPVLYEEEMFLPAIEDKLVWSIFTDSLDSFNLEQNWLCLHITRSYFQAIPVKFPSHAPCVLHSIALIDVICIIFCDLVVANLEGHHPRFTIAIEIRHADIALNECWVDFRLIVNLRYLVHVFVKDEDMLVSHDKQMFVTIESIDRECITEHFWKVCSAIKRIFSGSLPWLATHHSTEYHCFWRRLMTSICEENRSKLFPLRSSCKVLRN